MAQFVGELATSSVLYVRIRSLNAGRTAAEFKVDGAPAAIACRARRLSGQAVAPPPQRVATAAAKRRQQT